MSAESGGQSHTNRIIQALFVQEQLSVNDFDHPMWNAAQPATIDRYWSGEEAPAGRHAEARILWSQSDLYVRFIGRQEEPLIISSQPQTSKKTIGLWDRDVCEIFVATNKDEPNRYFEFEVAPTGEWLDVAVEQRPYERLADWGFDSGLSVAARIDEAIVTSAMRIPLEALNQTPVAGEHWRGNLYRCVGTGETRGYLAWQPTHTPEPNFHVPDAFGWIAFEK